MKVDVKGVHLKIERDVEDVESLHFKVNSDGGLVAIVENTVTESAIEANWLIINEIIGFEDHIDWFIAFFSRWKTNWFLFIQFFFFFGCCKGFTAFDQLFAISRSKV